MYRSSGHAISHPPIVRQVCCKCSCRGGPVCHKRRSQSFLWPFALKCLSTLSILHRPRSVRFSSVYTISRLLSQNKSCKPLPVDLVFQMITNSGLFWVSLERVVALRRFYLIFKVPLYALRTTGIPTQQMWEKATPLANTLSIIVKTYY